MANARGSKIPMDSPLVTLRSNIGRPIPFISSNLLLGLGDFSELLSSFSESLDLIVSQFDPDLPY